VFRNEKGTWNLRVADASRKKLVVRTDEGEETGLKVKTPPMSAASSSSSSSPVDYSREGEFFLCKLLVKDGQTMNMFMRARDGWIHATKIAQAYGRRTTDWFRTAEAKAAIKRLESENLPDDQAPESDTQIHTSQIGTDDQAPESDTQKSITGFVEVHKGRSSKHAQGTWLHPNLGIEFAAWCSVDLKLQIIRYYRELILTGSATLGQLKTDKELHRAFQRMVFESPEEEEYYRKSHEHKFKQFLDSHGELYTYDRQSAADPAICGKYRPDFLFQLPSHCIIIEVDEDEHRGEDAQ
jgi:hypothetical protein